MSRFVCWFSLALAAGCGFSGSSDTPDAALSDGNPIRPEADAAPGQPDAAAGQPDAAPTTEPTCPAEYIGTGDGCDCGCNVFDPDCPTPLHVDDCDYDNCGDAADPDPDDPTTCVPIVLPQGWTCSAYAYGGDGVCSCGCGALDDEDCPSDLEIDDCYYAEHGCPTGSWPDPADPTHCTSAVAGWTCNWKSYYGDLCTCGCGVVDPGCPAEMHVSQCTYDGCPSGQSPDPEDLTQCIEHAPQDTWDCDLTLLYDGAVCDCGCGAVDPDCPTNATPASCDVTHCGYNEELQPGSISECWEICEPLEEQVGSATCTNGGFIEIFNSCERDLYACTDGHHYEVECTAGECVCRVDGKCVSRETGSCSLSYTCGWSLIDAT